MPRDRHSSAGESEFEDLNETDSVIFIEMNSKTAHNVAYNRLFRCKESR
jgi:hypothetical protein